VLIKAGNKSQLFFDCEVRDGDASLLGDCLSPFRGTRVSLFETERGMETQVYVAKHSGLSGEFDSVTLLGFRRQLPPVRHIKWRGVGGDPQAVT
jgi:hypothetical protein